MDKEILAGMVEQFRQKHSALPKAIYLHPVAAAALAARAAVTPVWNGIPVRVVDRLPPPGNALVDSLALFVRDGAIRSYDV